MIYTDVTEDDYIQYKHNELHEEEQVLDLYEDIEDRFESSDFIYEKYYAISENEMLLNMCVKFLEMSLSDPDAFHMLGLMVLTKGEIRHDEIRKVLGGLSVPRYAPSGVGQNHPFSRAYSHRARVHEIALRIEDDHPELAVLLQTRIKKTMQP